MKMCKQRVPEISVRRSHKIWLSKSKRLLRIPIQSLRTKTNSLTSRRKRLTSFWPILSKIEQPSHLSSSCRELPGNAPFTTYSQINSILGGTATV